MASVEVSVVLPAWNSHETVAACLESLRSQTFRQFETIVVDSSPGRETEEIVLSRFCDVRYHRSPRRLLPHAARNLGAGLARGSIPGRLSSTTTSPAGRRSSGSATREVATTVWSARRWSAGAALAPCSARSPHRPWGRG